MDELIFDPASKHYGRAFRRGDPPLPEPDRTRWQAARRAAIRHIVDAVLGSPAGPHLVARGSLTLKAVLGSEAREPGDIDWVIQPESIRMNDAAGEAIVWQALDAVSRDRVFDEDCAIDVASITHSHIWTYERAPGCRLAFPWRCGKLPPAVIQMDFVFEQELHTPIERIELQFDGLPAVQLMAASEAESLAWKVLWLYSDMHPQGKDLYDAVLLAKRVELPSNLLRKVLEDGNHWKHCHFAQPFPLEDRQADWENFLKECPWVQGSAGDWRRQLEEAIAPAVDALRAERSLEG